MKGILTWGIKTILVVVVSITYLIRPSFGFCEGYANLPDSTQEKNTTNLFLCGDTVTDIDGNHYSTVLIGSQCWMKENLRVTHLPDGTAIPYLESATEWQNLAMTNPGYGYHSNDSNLAGEYGALYSWTAAMAMEEGSWSMPSGVQGICPDGWHLPSDSAWTILIDYLGSAVVAGGKLKKEGYLQWNFPNFGGTNSSGFSALPGGGISNFYQGLGQQGFYWSSSDFAPNNAWTRVFFYGYASVSSGGYAKNNGYSVRCLADSVDLSSLQANAFLSQPTCYGYQDGAIDLSVVGGISPYSYLWNTSATTEDLTFVASGQYSVTIIDAGQDTLTLIWLLDQPSELLSNSLTHAVSCPGCSDGAASVELSGGTTPYQYFWANGGSTSSAAGLPVGNTTLTVFDDKSCMWTDTIEVPCCGSASPFICGDSIIDYDGNSYKTIQIGDQCWMAQDLRVSHNPDGSPINYVNINADWAGLTNSDIAFTYYNNDSVLASEYGALYTWAAAANDTGISLLSSDTVQGICPDGWRLPSDNDWKELEGASDSQYGFPHAEWNLVSWRGFDAGKNLKSNTLWIQNSNGDNFSGFSAVPGGYRNGVSGLFSNLGNYSYYWTSTSKLNIDVWARRLAGAYIYSERYESNYLSNGYSVRCVKNENSNFATVIINTPPGWNYSLGLNFHTILIPDSATISINNNPIEIGDYVGVFYDSLGTSACAGCLQWTGQGLEMFAIADNLQTIGKEGFLPGELFSWKIWRYSDSTELSAIATYIHPPIVPDTNCFVLNGLSMVSSLETFLTNYQTIFLPQGWSMFSTYIDAFEPSLDSIFNPIINLIIIVKDEAGQIFWPQFNLNLIGDIEYGEGYQIKVVNTNSLIVEGYAVQPENEIIILNQGWSFFGYLRQTPAPIESMLSPVFSGIIIVKNGSGEIYWPVYTLNTIGNMNPGEGYQIKMNSAHTLVYPPN